MAQCVASLRHGPAAFATRPRLSPPKAACEAGRLFNSCSRLSTRHSRGRSLALRLRHVLVDRSAHEERVDLALARSQFSEISSNDAWSTDAQEVVAGIAAVELPGLGHADLKLLQTAPTGCARTDHPSRPASRRARPGPGIVQTTTTRLTVKTTTICAGSYTTMCCAYRGTCHVLLGSLRSFPELGT